MNVNRFSKWRSKVARAIPHYARIGLPAALLLVSVPAFAQSDPWDNAVQVLQTAFTGTIARGLADAGADIAVVGRNEAKSKAAAAELAAPAGI